jgi:DNA-binding MurR/RpiR family transcriptional regulator
MAAAGRIEMYGVGGSAFIADMAYHKWLKLGLSVIAITDPHIQLMSASLLTKRDVAIGISDSGTSVQIVYALEKARQSGAATIAITGHDRSPICKVSDIVLLTRATDTVETESLCRRAVQVNLIECLAVAVGIKNYEQSVETIRKTDAAVVSYKL